MGSLVLVKYIFVLLHIVTAAAWFGLGLRLAGQARAVAGLQGASASALAADVSKTVQEMGKFVVLTLLFALGAFFTGGGFGGYPPNYHTALLLMVGLVALHFGLIAPAWRSLERAAGSSGNIEAARKKVAMGMGLGHLLWTVILILMYAHQMAAALGA